jgi:hypothetical protein
VSVEKFLKQRAVNIAVGGSYTLANWYDRWGKPRTFACRTTRVSPFRMLVDVPVVGKVGDPITSYFSDFGKLEGIISDIKTGLPARTRDDQAHAGEALEQAHLAGKEAERSPHSRCQEACADRPGKSAFNADPLAVGACIGRVVRLLPNGFAVKFVERQNRQDLNRLITRPIPLLSAGGAKVAPARVMRVADTLTPERHHSGVIFGAQDSN